MQTPSSSPIRSISLSRQARLLMRITIAVLLIAGLGSWLLVSRTYLGSQTYIAHNQQPIVIRTTLGEPFVLALQIEEKFDGASLGKGGMQLQMEEQYLQLITVHGPGRVDFTNSVLVAGTYSLDYEGTFSGTLSGTISYDSSRGPERSMTVKVPVQIQALRENRLFFTSENFLFFGTTTLIFFLTGLLLAYAIYSFGSTIASLIPMSQQNAEIGIPFLILMGGKGIFAGLLVCCLGWLLFLFLTLSSVPTTFQNSFTARASEDIILISTGFWVILGLACSLSVLARSLQRWSIIH